MCNVIIDCLGMLRKCSRFLRISISEVVSLVVLFTDFRILVLQQISAFGSWRVTHCHDQIENVCANSYFYKPY